MKEVKLATIAKPVAWRVGVWGDGSTPYGRSNIFCDEHEATIVANIATHHAEVIVAAHNAALSELAVAPKLIENVAYICGEWEKNQGASSLTIAVRLLLAALDNDKEQRNG